MFAAWSFSQAQPRGLRKSQGFCPLPGAKEAPSEEPEVLDTVCTSPTRAIPKRVISSPPPGMFCHSDSTRGRALRSHVSLDPSFFQCQLAKPSSRGNHETSAAGVFSSGLQQPSPCGNPAALLRWPLPVGPAYGSSSLGSRAWCPRSSCQVQPPCCSAPGDPGLAGAPVPSA